MRTILLILMVLSCYSAKSQYYFSREKIKFYIDGELLTKEQSDSITILVKKGNEVMMLKDSIYLGSDGDSVVSLHFMLYDRVMTFKKIKIGINFDEVTDNSAAFKVYEFRYTHVEKLIPYTRKNLKEAGFNDYEDVKIKKNAFFDPGKKIGIVWYFGNLKLNGKRLKNSDLLYGVSSFTHNGGDSLTRIYGYYDFLLGNEG